MKYIDTEVDDFDSVNLNRHRKKRPSNVSKSIMKSKHRHEYEECMLISDNGQYNRAEYCIHCGKIHNVFMFETMRCSNGYYKQMSQDEVKKTWSDLKRFHVSDIWENVVNLEE